MAEELQVTGRVLSNARSVSNSVVTLTDTRPGFMNVSGGDHWDPPACPLGVWPQATISVHKLEPCIHQVHARVLSKSAQLRRRMQIKGLGWTWDWSSGCIGLTVMAMPCPAIAVVNKQLARPSLCPSGTPFFEHFAAQPSRRFSPQVLKDSSCQALSRQ